MSEDKLEQNPATDKAESEGLMQDPKNVQELTGYIQNMLQQMQERFQMMSDQIITRIDDMGSRIDDLEHNINDLMSQAGNASNPALTQEKESK
ncbi:heat shock factor-binding protein 1 [Eurytemora carolleeae]|uniref:heat shock factor-binding protein 1 n=1 Tax=Eurytemora carolleeae TaxID=1294199 RepID=UPI000C782F10|nr:heat shock factor-binding protein 1 [Eurytemora carolleeae]|eukprot:XP_023334078.1 heat shock factor-binding protein 1-like [Eurytemora affinis]